MPIETLDDVIEDIANQFNRYGAHEEEGNPNCLCRMCFTAGLAERIRRAARIEQLLKENYGPDNQRD